MATDTRAEPNTFPTTVGMVEKNPPLAIPLIMTKTINGPMDVETGQRISMLRALSKSDMNRVFNGPSRSLQKPHISLPTAEEKLNAATIPAPTPEVIPIDSVYNGRKNGGTKSGKVAIAPTANSKANRMSRKSRL